MANPVLYAKLMDFRLQEPYKRLHEHFQDQAHKDAKAVENLLWTAYQEGVRDGFAQGIAAAESDQPPASQEEQQERRGV